MKRVIAGLTVGMVLLVLLLSGCSSSAPPAAPKDTAPETKQSSNAPASAPAAQAKAPAKITVGLVSKVYGFMPIWAAEDRGFYKENNVTIEMMYLDSSAKAMAALAGGSIDISVAAPGATMLASEKGEDVIFIGGMVNRAMYTLVGQPKMTFKDLKGQKIGVAGMATGDTIIVKSIMDKEGMSYPKDYSLIQVGGTPDRYAALQSGSIAAGLLLIPQNYQAINNGFSRMADAYNYIPEYQHTGLNAKASWAEKNQDALVGFLKANIKAINWLYDNRAESNKVAVKYMGVDEKIADMAWEEFTSTKAFPKDGSVTIPGTERVIEETAISADMKPPYPKPEKFTVLKYLEKAQGK